MRASLAAVALLVVVFAGGARANCGLDDPCTVDVGCCSTSACADLGDPTIVSSLINYYKMSLSESIVSLSGLVIAELQSAPKSELTGWMNMHTRALKDILSLGTISRIFFETWRRYYVDAVQTENSFVLDMLNRFFQHAFASRYSQMSTIIRSFMKCCKTLHAHIAGTETIRSESVHRLEPHEESHVECPHGDMGQCLHANFNAKLPVWFP